MIWYENPGKIVISSRIRLARNIDDVPFPNALENKKELTDIIKSTILNDSNLSHHNFQYYNIDEMSLASKQSLAEEHLISLQMIKGTGHSALINKDKTTSIMLMEEDHIRLQVIMGGYCLDEAYEEANKIDDILEKNLNYAFDEDFGYLTACPTNTGTGLRASAMLHLPALAMTNSINKIMASASKLGIAIRGFYGEGSGADGSFYQISNQITAGESETEIIKRVKNIIDQIVNLEEQARQSLIKNSQTALFEKIYRSYGILKYTHSISSEESKSLISDVLLGQNLGIITNKGILAPMECIIRTEPAKLCGSEDLTPAMRDNKRAEIIRNNI